MSKYLTSLFRSSTYQVKFDRVNRHFNVPNPFPNNEYRDHDLSSEVADQKRFYR